MRRFSTGISLQDNALAYGLGGCFAIVSVMGIGRFVYTPILPAMMGSLGLNPADAGFIASANYIGYLLGAIIVGWNWSTGREYQAVMIGLAMSALLCLAMTLHTNVWFFAFIRLGAGFTSAITMVLSTAIVFKQFARLHKPGLDALHFGGVGIGITISAILIASIHYAGFGWKADWIGAALVSAVLLLLARILITPPKKTSKPQEKSAQERHEPPLPNSFAFHALALAYGIFGFGYVITATFLITIVRQNGGDSLMEAMVWIITGLSAAPSIWLWGPVARRAGLFKALAITAVLEAVGIAASVTVPSPFGPIIGGMLLGITFMALTAFCLQAAHNLAPASPKRSLARLTIFFSVGQVFGPLMAGFMAEKSGSFTSSSLVAAFSLLLCAIIGLAAERSVNKSRFTQID